MRIGITEQGDAGLNFAWFTKLTTHKYDGAVLITKNVNDKFIEYVNTLRAYFPNILLHIGCTGWGGTWLEPNVPPYTFQLKQLQKLLDSGFPADHIVLRIDPIIPTPEGLDAADKVLHDFSEMHTGIRRVRISLLDEYRHVKERIRNLNRQPFYGNSFYPPSAMRRKAATLLANYPNLQFETCAESVFARNTRLPNLKEQGCISEIDLKLFGLTPDPAMLTNMQQRTGCHCLACKSELLSDKHPCPHQCVYCYWHDAPSA